ncbi:MAG: endolytic transglycosylase MltG, partial [Vicinamibacteria bacterium]
KIARGDVYTRPITFREGLTMADMARHYEASGFGTAEDFLAAARDPSLVADLDPAARDLEGYLFPNTYTLPRSATAPDLVRRMVALFRDAFDEDLRAAATAQGFTVREVVTLASLIEKETGLDAERRLVAAVYRNRLRIGMGMQADPTVIYALMLAGTWDGNLTRADLQFDSPYNTYRYRGLPPGPIANPGAASLGAALDPEDVDYLYFVSRNDGSHVFSRTLAEHNRAVREWQVEYFRQRRLNRQR